MYKGGRLKTGAGERAPCNVHEDVRVSGGKRALFYLPSARAYFVRLQLTVRHIPWRDDLLLLETHTAKGKFMRHLVVGANDRRATLEEEQDHHESVEPEASFVLRLPPLHERPTGHLTRRW